MNREAAVEATALSLANKATYGGAGSMIIGGMVLSDVAIIVGAIVGVVGIAVKWYYTMKHYKLAKWEAEARIRHMKGDCE